MKLYELPVKCPVCQGGFHVARLGCENCGSTLEGNFKFDEISMLPGAMRQFVVNFLRCRGSIKEMEKLYGISYPTVRARIDEILAALGEQPEPDAPINGDQPAKQSEQTATAGDAQKQPRLEVLKRLAAGEIDAEEARNLLT